jgi:hypothetical protein
VSAPQVIDDEDHERVWERVAAVDVAKASGMVCIRAPHPSRPGTRRSTAWPVPATMNAVLGLAARLAGEGIEKVTLESTSDYWRIWYYVLGAPRGAVHSGGDGRAPPPGRRSGLVKLAAA